jgi:predicted type IV restriction endonuclease
MANLLNLIAGIKADQRVLALDEALTKNGVILPILNELGWNPFNIDEVQPEYTVANKRVDYALRVNNHNKAFIEVKKIGTDLEQHQEQLLNYSFQEGVRLAILTNGIAWWFYLPLLEGSWEQRKFYTIDIYDQQADEVALKFQDFLLRENVISGKAIETAENVYKSKQKKEIIKSTIPKAWNKLVTEPDEDLIELVAEMTERLSGYKPDHPTVAAFLGANSFAANPPFTSAVFEFPSRPIKTARAQTDREDYRNTSVDSFVFEGKRHTVTYWKDVLTGVTEIMLKKHRDQFSQVLSLVGRKRPYFTKAPNELRVAERIDETDIFVEINVSANRIVTLSRRIVALFGYANDSLSFNVQSPSES